MTIETTTHRIAIVGAGPRGSFALENILCEFSKLANDKASADKLNTIGVCDVHVYEASRYPGCGPNYAPDQLASNQLNVPLRSVPMASRAQLQGIVSLNAFPSFKDWYHHRNTIDDTTIDHFPPRAQVGSYLQERFMSLLEVNSEAISVKLITAYVVDVQEQSKRWVLTTDQTTYQTSDQTVENNLYDDVLFCIGHQPTALEEQLVRWGKQTDDSEGRVIYMNPYPSERIAHDEQISSKSTVALRGMGLSTIDVVKSLTIERGGRFEAIDELSMKYRYHPSGREPAGIAPFSLDGQPMAPKPINEELDLRYRPPSAVIESIEQTLKNHKSNEFQNDGLRDQLIDLVSDAALPIYQSLCSDEYPQSTKSNTNNSAHDTQTAIRQWLLDESFKVESIVDTQLPTADIMHRFLDMATGQCQPSLDYCIGQVWKHCQPIFYRSLSFRSYRGDVIASAIALDQRMKRYAFGPPVEATAYQLALCDANILHFRVADDPDITLTNEGWAFCENQDAILANCLINTVLSEASVDAMDTPIVRKLQRRELINLVHEKLGARAFENGHLSSSKKSLSGSGRLITGTVFEADALDCCYGEDLPGWAKNTVARGKAVGSL